MRKFISIMLLASMLFSSAALAIEQSLLLKLLELKRESYLAKRGEVALDLVLSYTQDYSVVPWYVVKSSSYNMNANIRLGISNRLEATLRLPFTSMLRDEFVGSWETYRAAGMRDPIVTFEYELLQERFNRPATYLVVGARLPLGRSSYDGLKSDELALGSGHYATNWGLSFLKSIDPCVVYWGLEYLWTLRRDDYDPADIISYNGGLAWSLNQQASLSLGISGAVVGEDKRSGQPASTAYNTTALSIGTTFILSPNVYLNPTVMYGLTEEEDDFLFSFGLSMKK
jgi:hypothetical protein